jgi:hypothetical protein
MQHQLAAADNNIMDRVTARIITNATTARLNSTQATLAEERRHDPTAGEAGSRIQRHINFRNFLLKRLRELNEIERTLTGQEQSRAQ